MANICSTNITFYSKRKKSLIAFKEVFEELYRLGNGEWYAFLDRYSISADIHCRGVIEHYDDEINYSSGHYNFEVISSDSWSPPFEMWRLILTMHFPLIKMVVSAEESGMDVYINTDKEGLYYLDKYLVEVFYDDWQNQEDFFEYCTDKEDVVDALKRALNVEFEFKDINQLEDDVDKYLALLNNNEGADVSFQLRVFGDVVL